ncbi:hypothetical protein WR25_16601 isoform J [Diploscapter pachys]|uniref:SEC7 domain-containing protein n=1 Tax=Diploscapter pachys TaxID=2018661 RepID=A0A2A2KYZ5_9BILA|nr:hypothetical protein WR25_16601 isoform J [Diploscapter pachys]
MNHEFSGYDMVLTTDSVCDTVIHHEKIAEDKPTKIEKGEEADSESEAEDIRSLRQKERPEFTLKEEVTEGELATATEPAPEQMPYGLPCCRELLRFLIALTNPYDRQNTESMIVLGLNLITVALEAAADHLASYSFLVPLIKDNLCRSLLQLLDTEKLPVLAATNRVCFLLFESMRVQLKFQLETYFHKLRAIVTSEQRTTSYEQKEMALEYIVQLWRIPGLVTELYLNYDCDLYCSNVFEDLTKLLVENAFPVQGLHSATLLSLDALLVVIDTIDQNCMCRQAGRAIESDGHKTNASLDLPILSGYEIAKKIMAKTYQSQDESRDSSEEPKEACAIVPRANRHAASEDIPSMSEVIDQKKRKRIFAEGTELFNQSPKEGIAYLREKALLGSDAASVVAWLRENPQLDKKKIADYICSRKNADVLEAFVKAFPFENTRLDVALRMFLETFRLPGEAAEISMVMQHFSEQWYRANHEPFNHVDAAFTLSYAIIMLNTDQHNPQVRRNQPPMTVDCFKRNLSGTNGGQDFDPEMLDTMYNAIKTDEIVMPAEQTGLVKENYLWKVLLRRGETSEGRFIHAPSGWNDHDLFSVCWGPAVAALSYVFDKSEHDLILQKTLNGYRKCASISAHYGMKDVFDNLVIHLCKFSTLSAHRDGNSEETLEMQRQRVMNEPLAHSHSPEAVALAFGENKKAQLATKTLFHIQGWKNLLEVVLQLFKARLLPAELIEVDDFVDEKGWVSIQRVHNREHHVTRNDNSFFSWLGIGGGASDAERKKPTQDQLNAMQLASTIISECRPQQLVSDSKYLTSTALSEFIAALVQASHAVLEHVQSRGGAHNKQALTLSGEDEDALVFYLEMLISITLENKDRLSLVWPVVRRHLEWLLSAKFGRCPVLVERAVVGLLRVANRNLFRDNTVADDVLQSLSLLLRLSPKALFVFSRQIAYGLHDLLRTNAANVHKKEHWTVLFALLEAAGAAALPEDTIDASQHEPSIHLATTAASGIERNAYSDSEQRPATGLATESSSLRTDKGYTSDVPGDRRTQLQQQAATGSTDALSSRSISPADSAISLERNSAGGSKADWIHLDHRDAARSTEEALRALGGKRAAFNRGSLVLRTGLGRHEPAAFLKVYDCVAFLLRDAVHVSPDNYESCIQCLRTMVEASLDGGCYAAGPLSSDAQNRLKSSATEKKHKVMKSGGGKKELSTEVDEEEIKQEEQQLSASYQQVSLHLLDLCSTLHNQIPTIFAKWATAGAGEATVDASIPFIWSRVWRPLLQAMARLGCDCRRLVRAGALTHLQRAFLPSNMSNLGAVEWESCFGEVLFPLLTKLLEPFSQMDPIGAEDTRVRAVQIVAKTLLNHLNALSSLDSFPALWLRLLDYMEQYLRVDSCGNLNEAVPESLKNMLLVLDNTELFATIAGLYQMTVERLKHVLPQLIRDTIPNPPSTPASAALASSSGPTSPPASSSGLQKFGKVQLAPAVAVPLSSSTSTASPPTSMENVAAASETATGPVQSANQQPEQATDEQRQATAAVQIPQAELAYQQHLQYQQQQQQQQQQAQSAYSQQSYGQMPAASNYPSTSTYSTSQTVQSQHYMPQANLAEALATQVPPNYQPPVAVYSAMQQQTSQQMMYSVANPLPIQHTTVVPSPNSAFSQISSSAENLHAATHQHPYHQMPGQQQQDPRMN